MSIWQKARAGKNSVMIQAGGSVSANALGKNSTVSVRGNGNQTAGAGASGNSFGSVTQVSGARGVSINSVSSGSGSSIAMDGMKIQSDGYTVDIVLTYDKVVYINGTKVWPVS